MERAASKAISSKKSRTQAASIFNQPDTEDTFPFFALPSELRLLVYEELLVTDDRLLLTWRGPVKAIKQQKKMHTAIMRTCKTAAQEGATVLYGENVFDFQEIRQRPSIAKPFLRRIGLQNATFIRVVVCEYSAASEELSSIVEKNLGQVSTLTRAAFEVVLEEESDKNKAPLATTHRLTMPFMESFFKEHGIHLDQLRVLAISIVPYGADDATNNLLTRQAPALLQKGMQEQKLAWLEQKNAGLDELAGGICEREKRLKKADFFKDVDSKICIVWNPPFSGRRWIAYRRTTVANVEDD